MLYQSTCIRLLLPNPLYLLLCHYLIIPLCYWYTNLHRVLEKKGRKDDTKSLKPTQCNYLTLFFCINMAVMICNDSIVSYAWMTNLFWCILWPFLSTRKYKMAVFALCMRSTNLHWCVLGLCISFERSQPLVEILKLIKEQLQQKIFSLSANNYLASHGAKTFIFSLLKTLLHSNVNKPFLNSKTHREHYSHFNSKKSVFCLPRKREERLTCLWRNVSDVLISSSFACHSHQIFHQYNLRFTQCLNMIRFPIFLRRIPNNFRSRLTRF